MDLLLGCDTLVATATATSDGSLLFAKNSDRLTDECQHLRSYAAQDWAAGEQVRTQYLALPQARRTHRVLGGQPFWLWGFEQGINEHGVVIGNEAIWTTAPREQTGLLGMDLIRLGLERGATAREALEVIVALLAEYGQGGSPRHNDPSAAAYDNSFILADPREAWVLETSGRDWVAKQATGVYSISNAPTLGRDFDLASQAIRDRPDVDFARDLGDWEGHPSESGTTRCGRSRLLLSNARGRIDVPAMMRFLSDHGPEAEIPGGWAPGGSGPATICVHPGGGQTAASLVAHLRPNGGPITAWCSLVTPCLSVFLPFYPDSNVPAALAHGGAEFDPASPWWRIKRLVEHASANWQERYPALRSYWQGWQQALLEQEPAMANAPAPERSTWVTRNVETLLRRLGEAEKRLDG